MNFEIIPTRQFEKEIKRLVKKFPSLKKEYSELIYSIQLNPTSGTPVGNNCYKIRIAISSKNKGKSGGARVISYVFFKQKNVYLLTIYDKSEKENVSEKELKMMVNSLEFDDDISI